MPVSYETSSASTADAWEPFDMPEYDSNQEEEEYPEDDCEETADDVTAPAKSEPLPMLLDDLGELRPARLVSFEQEIGGDSCAVTSALHSEGLISDNRVWPYQGGGCSEWLHMEEDSSVDGELVYSRLRLNKPRVARQVHDALQVVQRCKVDGDLSLDSRCGFHIHVGIGYDSTSNARCYSAAAYQSLYHLWGYLEDPITRLASANWKLHRTERGNDYSSPTRKGLSGAREIGQWLSQTRSSLNLEPFLRSRAHCDCGAFQFGDWADCQCEHLPQPTVEFRVFNATVNTRKIRAYAALCLALVAYAERNNVTPITHPVLAWQGTYSLHAKSVAERMRFILRDLPLTDAERDDLRYCAEKAPGGMADVVRGIRRRRGHGRVMVTA